MDKNLTEALQAFDGRTLKKMRRVALDLLTKRNPRAYLLALSEIMAVYPDAKILYAENASELPDDTGVNIKGAQWEGLGALISKVFPILQHAGVPVDLNVQEEGTDGSLTVMIGINSYFPHKELDFMTKLDGAGEVAISTVVEKLKAAWVPDAS